METNKHLVPLAIVLAGAMVAGAIYLGGNKGQVTSATPTESENVNIPEVTSNDHLLGSPNAEVVIIEYSDTECPWCKVFHLTMHQIVNEYDGKVAWVYRHMPFHQKSLKEAQATECAYEVGGNQGFWQYIDRLFEITPSNDGLDLNLLPQIASDIGLNTESFNQCLSSDRHLDSIKKNLDLARRGGGGVSGTPYSLIISGDEELVISGAEPIESVRAKIDSLLQ